MAWLNRFKYYFFPFLFLILPAGILLYYHVFNWHYRGVGSPFLYPALGLLLLSLFFWIKKKWIYLLLIAVTALYVVIFFRYLFIGEIKRSSVVYYYREWALNTQNGHILLKKPVGDHPPPEGSYVSCNFSMTSWKSYLTDQPVLCTAFDPQLRLRMFLNDHDTSQGRIREVQLNQFQVGRNSLLGEPLDRAALRIAFEAHENKIQVQFRLRAIYQVFEREISPGETKIVESFSRDSHGRLKSFTESPVLKFSTEDVYALYDGEGALVEIPKRQFKNFSFPANIDVRRHQSLALPTLIKDGDLG